MWRKTSDTSTPSPLHTLAATASASTDAQRTCRRGKWHGRGGRYMSVEFYAKPVILARVVAGREGDRVGETIFQARTAQAYNIALDFMSLAKSSGGRTNIPCSISNPRHADMVILS